MVLLSDQIQEFIDWLKEMTDFGEWDESVQIEVHKKLIEYMISVPIGAPPERVSEGKELDTQLSEIQFRLRDGDTKHERWSRIIADARNELAARPAVANRFDCETCGKGIAVDEDGCCRTCGADAIVIVAARPIMEPRED